MSEDKLNLLLEEEPVKIKEAAKPVILLSFDRWFSLQNRPSHHKTGMKAFAGTKGKKTKDAWDRIFKGY